MDHDDDDDDDDDEDCDVDDVEEGHWFLLHFLVCSLAHPMLFLLHCLFFLTCDPPPQVAEQGDQELQAGRSLSIGVLGGDKILLRQLSGQ